ncbi:hypothetical protein MKX01_020451 [Papaver californicum]|nr:hypothetical protein MKX01_020451 [Papaver californicum]
MAKANKLFPFLLRFIAFSSTLSAAIVMATSHEKATVLNISFEAKYSNTPFKFFFIGNAIGCVYSLLVLFIPFGGYSLGRVILALDTVILPLIIKTTASYYCYNATSCVSAAVAIAYMGKKGNSHAGWLPICGQVTVICDHVTGALIAGFIGVIIYLLLLLSHSINPLLFRRISSILSLSFPYYTFFSSKLVGLHYSQH